MELLVLPDGKFTCSCCARCCYDWHVELLDEEIVRVSSLPWPAGDEMHGKRATLLHAGKTYLAKRDDASCVFLNRTNGLCRIHEKFGTDSKPLGCKLYPFQIVPTTKNEATVTARFDCPRVRQNIGEPHAAAVPELRGYERQLRLAEPFDERTRNGFKPEQIEFICEFAGIMLAGFADDRQRSLFLLQLCDWLESVRPSEVDRATLAKQFPSMKSAIETAMSGTCRRPNLFHRVAFRTLLGLYLRRDEDVLNGLAGRTSRLIGMIAIVVGIGRLSTLGRHHPRSRLTKAKLFRGRQTMENAEVFALLWNLIRDKLASQQFMGSANPNHDFLRGLRSMALLYPLVSAVARCVAADRGSTVISVSDVDYAVGAIGHAFGRSPILAQPLVGSLEKLLLDRRNFTRLSSTV